MTHNKKWCHGIELCTSWIIADIVCNCASIWNLVLISIDRALAISYPFRYREMITKRKACVLIALVWSGSFLMAFLGMLNWTFPGKEHIFTVFSCQKSDRVYYTVAASVGFFLPLVIVLISYGKTYVLFYTTMTMTITRSPLSYHHHSITISLSTYHQHHIITTNHIIIDHHWSLSIIIPPSPNHHITISLSTYNRSIDHHITITISLYHPATICTLLSPYYHHHISITIAP